MPIFDDDAMEQHKVTGTGFQFSAQRIDDLGATEYTLVGIAVDRSGSIAGHEREIEQCIKSVIESCQQSPRADNLMARVLIFDNSVDELHGFRELAACHTGAYDQTIRAGGMTALYDASVNLIQSMADYGKRLIEQDYSVNGIVCVITDGVDNRSTLTGDSVREAIGNAMQSESLESLVSVLIGVNVQNPTVSQYLREFKDQAQFGQYVEAPDASPKTLAKLAGFISKSVSSQSQSLGSKQASQPLQF